MLKEDNDIYFLGIKGCLRVKCSCMKAYNIVFNLELQFIKSQFIFFYEFFGKKLQFKKKGRKFKGQFGD